MIKGSLRIKFHDKYQAGEDVLQVKGYYNFASRMLVLQPPEDDRLGLVCKFRGGHDDKCEASIVHEASLKSCSDFIFVKQVGWMFVIIMCFVNYMTLRLFLFSLLCSIQL